MDKRTVDLIELVSACIDLSERAGQIIREVAQSGELHTKDKDGGEDAITLADVKAQELIEGGLKTRWGKELKIIGEETLNIEANNLQPNTSLLVNAIDIPDKLHWLIPLSDVVVYVDPLDATREFTLGNTFCVVVLIGIAVKGQAVAGVMHQPFQGDRGRTIWGLNGVGTFGITPIPSNLIRKDNKYVLVTTRLHYTRDVQDQLDKLSSVVGEVVRVGGAGYKVIMLLEGKADIYFEIYQNPIYRGKT
jgi:3'(2'), 5'-bisphosphate nucleotidase